MSPYFARIGDAYYNLADWKEVYAHSEKHVEVTYIAGGVEEFFNDETGNDADEVWEAVRLYARRQHMHLLGIGLAEQLLQQAAASLSPAEALKLLERLDFVKEIAGGETKRRHPETDENGEEKADED